MAAWRGRRAMTWITGAVAFLVSIGTAFTGYLSQQNFDSQWIGGQAKDGLNASGIGAFFNVLNYGQMLLWHVVLLPLVVGAPDRGPRPARPPARRRAAAAGRRQERMSAAEYPLAPDPRVEWQGAQAPLRPRQGGGDRARRGARCSPCCSRWSSPRPTSKPVTIASGRRVAPKDFLATAAVGARRHERRRDLRAAVHPRRRRRPEPHRRPLDPAGARRADPDRPGARVRARPALDPGADRPDARAGAARLERATPAVRRPGRRATRRRSTRGRSSGVST